MSVLYIHREISFCLDSCVGAHNKLRKLHVDTPNLQWNQELARRAQEYAEKLVVINRRKSKVFMKHSNREGENIGENIYWRNNRQLGTCVDASRSWYGVYFFSIFVYVNNKFFFPLTANYELSYVLQDTSNWKKLSYKLNFYFLLLKKKKKKRAIQEHTFFKILFTSRSVHDDISKSNNNL